MHEDPLKAILKWCSPLWTFISGMFGMLLTFIFYPYIGGAAAAQKAALSGISSHYWGLNWVLDSTQLLLFLISLFLLLLTVALVWLNRR